MQRDGADVIAAAGSGMLHGSSRYAAYGGHPVYLHADNAFGRRLEFRGGSDRHLRRENHGHAYKIPDMLQTQKTVRVNSPDGLFLDLNKLILEGFRPLFMKLIFGKLENVLITIGLTNQLI